MDLKWIAKELAIGSWKHHSNLLRREQITAGVWPVMAILALVRLRQTAVVGTPPTSAPEGAAATPIRWSELGAQATAQYADDGLSVTATVYGARLRGAFQRLQGGAMREGLWLVSTAAEAKAEKQSI